MRKNLLLWIMTGILLSLNGCFHEADLTASHEEQNWYVLEDSDDALKHLQYLIYESFGVPVYYSDTIGSKETGKDVYGNPVIYYEILDPNYDLVNTDNEIEITLSTNRNDLNSMMNFMKDEVLPQFCSKELLPRCFLLVDSCFLACESESTRHEDYVYRSMMTSVVGYVNRLNTLTEEERERFIKRIVAEEWGIYLTEREKDRLTSFYVISETEVYSKSSTYGRNSTSSGSGTLVIPYKEWQEYGFLDYNHWYSYSEGKSYYTPNKLQDVVDYATEVLLGNDEAFKTQYADYDWVLQKYDIMKRIIEEVTADLSANR